MNELITVIRIIVIIIIARIRTLIVICKNKEISMNEQMND